MDPLALLREACIGGTLASITQTDDRIQFGNRFSFPKDVPTAYKSQQGRGGLYPLSSLLFFYRNRGLGGGQYLSAATKAGIPPVAFLDRKDVEAYLSGASDRSDYIQLTTPDLLPLQRPLDMPDQAGDAAEPAAKRARTDSAAAPGEPDQAGDLGERAALADLLSRERQLRDRNSQLLVPHKSFRSVLQILDQAQKKQSEKERERAKRDGAAPPSIKETLPVLPSRRFERPAGEGLKAMGIDEFGGQKIDAYGARKPAAPSSGGASTRKNGTGDDLPPPPPPPDGEGPAPLPRPAEAGTGSKLSVVPPLPPSAGQHRSSLSSHKHRPPASGRPSSQSGHHAGKHRQELSSLVRKSGGVPIILVPSAATATINMLNARAFLEECVYRFPKQVEEEGAKKATSASFSRTVGKTKPVVYHITERAPKPDSSDWHRVVAVFVTGQAWQFKGWPHKGAEEGDLALALSSMLGVYVGLKGEDVPSNVKKWNLLKVDVPKDNRHRDRPIVQDIFAALDKFLASRQSKLAY